jgi:hypothetical protein
MTAHAAHVVKITQPPTSENEREKVSMSSATKLHHSNERCNAHMKSTVHGGETEKIRQNENTTIGLRWNDKLSKRLTAKWF